MQLQDFQSSIAAEIGLDTADATELSRITRWVNDGVVDVLRRTRCKVQPASMTITPNTTGDYDLDASILDITSLILNEQYGPLQHRTPEEIDNYRRFAVNDLAVCYALAGNDLLMLYPNPSSTTTATMRVVSKPASQLAAATDDPSNLTYGGIPTELHYLIELYGFWKAAAYRRDTSSGNGQLWQQQYEASCRQEAMRLARKGGRTLSRARLATHPTGVIWNTNGRY